MDALFHLLPNPQPFWVRYCVTVLLVLPAFAIRLAMAETTGQYGFIIFILPIVASALLFDRGTGFFAAGLSAALISAIIPWGEKVSAHLIALSAFLVVTGCLVVIAEGFHRALVTAHNAQRAADLLLQEMSHRVKNKFAVISSIISLQARRSPDEVRKALEEVIARVAVMANVHDFLQRSREDGVIQMRDYLPSLCRSLEAALSGPRGIALSATSTDVRLPPDKALAVGVIVNELVTNAFKYAFSDDQPGSVTVELAFAEGQLKLSVTDNGKGCPTDIQGGLGSRLVTVFAAQLGGHAKWENVHSGCSASVTFPM